MHLSRKLCRLKWPSSRNGGRTTQKAPIKVWEDGQVYDRDFLGEKQAKLTEEVPLAGFFFLYFFMENFFQALRQCF
jgi:hypothetical protein